MTRRETIMTGVATVIVAISRVLALSRGPWDWDEILFLLGLRDYDVALHHPHPPGFPLFILAARSLMAGGSDPYRALQLVNLFASIAIVPAMVFLCRELRLSMRTSLSAALLFAFFPNVWFFGGTAFSDVAAIVLAIVACGLFLRGQRSSVAMIAGAVILGIAAGFRPQNLLVGAVPAAIAAWSHARRRQFGVPIAAAALVCLIVAGSYAGAVVATGGWDRYRGAVAAHQQYLATVDSFLSDIRPSLLQISDDFFIRPFRFPVVNVVLSLLALVSAARGIANRSAGVIIAIATFGPFWILAWLTLDFHSASRFSIGYMPLVAILVADGVETIAAPVARKKWVAPAAVAALVTAMIAWTWPGIALSRRELSPPMQAVGHILRTVPRGTPVYVQKRLKPYAEYFLDAFPVVHLETDALPAEAGRRGGMYLREGADRQQGAVTFAWPREPLWNIARRRYFAVSVVPVDQR